MISHVLLVMTWTQPCVDTFEALGFRARLAIASFPAATVLSLAMGWGSDWGDYSQGWCDSDRAWDQDSGWCARNGSGSDQDGQDGWGERPGRGSDQDSAGTRARFHIGSPMGPPWPGSSPVYYMMQPPSPPPMAPEMMNIWMDGYRKGFADGVKQGPTKQHAAQNEEEEESRPKKKRSKKGSGQCKKFWEEWAQENPEADLDRYPRWEYFDDPLQAFAPYPEKLQQSLREKLDDGADWLESVEMEHNVGNDELGWWKWKLKLFPLTTLTDRESPAKQTVEQLRKELGKKIKVDDIPAAVWLQGWQESEKGKKRLIRIVLEKPSVVKAEEQAKGDFQ